MEKEGKNYVIAIDGGAGVGKSTVSKKIANRLHILYLDTGAMYRAVALYFVSNKIDMNETNVFKYMPNIDISFEIGENNNNVVYVNGEDVTDKIRSEEVSKGASVVAQIQVVRDTLIAMQKNIAKNKSIIAEGRDMTTVVFTNATLKVYLVVDTKIAAKRRYEQLIKKGESVNFEDILKDVEERDDRDKRKNLKKADAAVLIDTTNMTVDEVVDNIIYEFEKAKNKK